MKGYSPDYATHNYKLAFAHVTTCIKIINVLLPPDHPYLITPLILFSYIAYIKAYNKKNKEKTIEVLKQIVERLEQLVILIHFHFWPDHYELKQIYEILFHKS